MVYYCKAGDIRSRLEEFRRTPLALAEEDRERFDGGGRWRSADKRFGVVLGRPMHFSFRSGELSRDNLSIVDGLIQIGAGCRISICVTTWFEDIFSPGSMQPLPVPREPAGIVGHVAIERLNYAYLLRDPVEALLDADLEQLADIIAPAMEEYLERRLAPERTQQARYGRHGVPVAGKLHWRWRDPVPELVTFHDLCAAFAQTASVARVTSLPLSKYRMVEQRFGNRSFVFEDDAAVVVTVPGINRDAPHERVVEVNIADSVIPVEIHDLSGTDKRGSPSFARSDDSVFQMTSYLLIHPQSPLLRPARVVDAVPKAYADAAAEHARNVWLIVRGKIFPAQAGIAGAREGQVTYSDVISI